jgi:hypothetical protein
METLLKNVVYHYSVRTMYRILASAAEVRECGHQPRHPR